MENEKQNAKAVIADHFNGLMAQATLGDRARSLIVQDVNAALTILLAEPAAETGNEEE